MSSESGDPVSPGKLAYNSCEVSLKFVRNFLTMGDYADMIVYQKAFKLALDIFQISKKFPGEEKYSLTDQIRRSSRSVCVNFVEAYRRRKYIAHFLSKLNDAETENAETQVWLEFALNFGYLSEELYRDFSARNSEIGKIIWTMINNPDKFR